LLISKRATKRFTAPVFFMQFGLGTSAWLLLLAHLQPLAFQDRYTAEAGNQPAIKSPTQSGATAAVTRGHTPDFSWDSSCR